MISRLKADLKFKDLVALLPTRNRFEEIKRFEISFAKLADQSHAIFFPYGRTAQLAVMNALNLIKKGKTEVILPSYSCVVVAHAIKKAGLTPVFVDVGDDYNMRIDLLFEATNIKTGAIIATSIFGHPVDLEALDSYRSLHPQIPILQDCAHSFFAQHDDGRFVHKSGLCAFYGLNISKIMTSVFGGIVTTDDQEFAERVKLQRDLLLKQENFMSSLKKSVYFVAALLAFQPVIYGLVNQLERRGYLNRFTKYYNEENITWPNDGFEWPSGLQARIGLIQCKRYVDIVSHRRKIANIYHQELQGLNNLKLPPNRKGATVSHYVIQTEFADIVERSLLSKGYQLGRLIDYEVPDMPIYKNEPYFGDHMSRDFPSRVLNLPVHKGVSKRKALAIAKYIKCFLN